MSQIGSYELEIWAGQLAEIAEEIECNGFFACPGYGHPYEHMMTCRACAARQQLNVIIKEMNDNANA